ncbi:drug/metabolite transporter superfamily protein [Striga asiatica]|uniref:Drug/metabolite transporter superfamily protein n=1 Tax=Striga asiatica TaxID=4170 RepID=A0A5A7Q214_STRAF|nr:drug/metabolite transporter superfamily protein [Striga asiatica]
MKLFQKPWNCYCVFEARDDVEKIRQIQGKNIYVAGSGISEQIEVVHNLLAKNAHLFLDARDVGKYFDSLEDHYGTSLYIVSHGPHETFGVAFIGNKKDKYRFDDDFEYDYDAMGVREEAIYVLITPFVRFVCFQCRRFFAVQYVGKVLLMSTFHTEKVPISIIQMKPCTTWKIPRLINSLMERLSLIFLVPITFDSIFDYFFYSVLTLILVYHNFLLRILKSLLHFGTDGVVSKYICDGAFSKGFLLVKMVMEELFQFGIESNQIMRVEPQNTTTKHAKATVYNMMITDCDCLYGLYVLLVIGAILFFLADSPSSASLRAATTIESQFPVMSGNLVEVEKTDLGRSTDDIAGNIDDFVFVGLVMRNIKEIQNLMNPVMRGGDGVLFWIYDAQLRFFDNKPILDGLIFHRLLWKELGYGMTACKKNLIKVVSTDQPSGNVVDVKQHCGLMVSKSEMVLPVVTVPASKFRTENGVIWASSPDRLELPHKAFHHPYSCDSQTVFQSLVLPPGSNREVLQKLSQQLKGRDDMIIEMEDQILNCIY